MRGRCRALLVVTLLLLVAPWRPAAAATEAEARTLVSGLTAESRTTFAGTALSRDERIGKLRVLLAKYGALTASAPDILGRYWDKATPDQRSRFVPVLADYVIATWAYPMAESHPDQVLEILGADSAQGRVVLHTRATSPDHPPTPMDWVVVSGADGRAVILDVQAENVSLVQTMKADFGSVLRGNGGQLDPLMAAMAAKTVPEKR